tara:strand:+ start:351 stop:932 length:582 start_codon:yes stop_codon:yes gene_type:complete
MANTTFNGSVRSENGFKQITLDAAGAATDNFTVDSSGNVSGTGTLKLTGQANIRIAVDNSTFNDSSGATSTLTAAQSGTIFNVDGTDDVVVNMPALSTGNVGLWYEFIVTTAVASGKTVTFVLPGSAVSNFYGMLQLESGTAANPVGDEAGDTLTLAATTALNGRVKLTCIVDDGTNSTWKAEALSTPIATIA